MNFENVVIESFGAHISDTVVTSTSIEDRLAPIYEKLKLPHGRLELMTGIKERRHWDLGTRPSSLSAAAGEKVLEKTKISKDDIGVLIHSSVCRDFLEPATASVVHNALGLNDNCLFFDLSNACLGVLNSFVVLGNMIENGQVKAGLIVSGENGGPLLEETIDHLLNDETLTRKSIKKYFANLTIGSGACAYLLCHKDLSPDSPKLIGGAAMSKSDAVELCQGDGNANSLMMETNSEELLHAGLELTAKTWKKTKEVLGWENSTPDWVIGHQVGVAHEKLILESLGVQDNDTHRTYPFLGNTGSAALPLTLIDLAESGKLKKDDLVALLGIGSGLSSIMLGVKW